jgi:hypothetical protein
MGVFFALLLLLGRSGLAPKDFLAWWVGFQFGLSSMGRALGVEGADLGAGLGASGGDAPASSASASASAGSLAASGSTALCQRFILSRTLAGLLMPIAFAKPLPSKAFCLSVAPIFLPAVPFLFCPAEFSGSLGAGEAGIESRGHWSWRQASQGR